MGFLSRKKKNPEPVVTEETHPLEEELARMEEAVPERLENEYQEPERSYDEYGPEAEYEDDVDEAPPTAGPVADETPRPRRLRARRTHRRHPRMVRFRRTTGSSAAAEEAQHEVVADAPHPRRGCSMSRSRSTTTTSQGTGG